MATEMPDLNSIFTPFVYFGVKELLLITQKFGATSSINFREWDDGTLVPKKLKKN